MNRFLPIAIFAISLCFSVSTKADDIIIPFGKNNLNKFNSPWKYKGGGTNLDAVAWKAIGYAETGWLTTNRSAFGYGTVPIKNTTLPQDASAGGVGPVAGRYPTIYFRNTVYIVDPNAYADNFRLNLQVDDGVVVWINGVEAYRNSMPAGAPAYATLASASGTATTVLTAVINKSFFVAGNNIIAVEVHNRAITGSTDASDLFFDLELRGLNNTVIRGSYIQSATQTAATIRWRSSAATNSRVRWGTTLGSYPNTVDDAASVTEHEVRITGLIADTKYYYTIGTTSGVISANQYNYFVTAPLTTANRKFRIMAIGDCGMGNDNQRDTRDALMNFMGTNEADALITMGDNAYSTGTDAQFQTGFFDIYDETIMRYNKLYTSPGNHDYQNTQTNAHLRNTAYYNNFSNPTAAENGGVASGTEAYYSYNIGNIHFLALDSYGVEDGATRTRIYDTLGAQVTWIKNDLAANTSRWTVAYFHHPPYTMTSHDSDNPSTDLELIKIRELFIRILERYGVDIVLCGHAHGFERSYLLKGYYTAGGTWGTPMLETAFNAATHTATGNTQNGKYNGTAGSCAYTYNSGKYNHGSMYIVAGSGGQLGGSAPGYPHNAMYFSNNANGGAFYFETDSNRLDAKFVSYTAALNALPVIRDSFTIFKDVNKVTDLVVSQNDVVNVEASWKNGTYVWPNNGSVTTRGVTLNTAATGTFNFIVRDGNTCLKDSFHMVVTPPLAVMITSFTAKLNKDIVLLDWTTSQEINSKFFSIEKSTDGTTFSLLGNVNASGNSSTPRSYHMNDLQPVEGINYYRLSETDINGSRKNIEIKRVTYKGAKDFNATIVNAGTGLLNVAIHNAVGGMVQLKVVDMIGREILKESVNSGNGNVTHTLQLTKGTYVLVLVNSKGETISTKIIAD